MRKINSPFSTGLPAKIYWCIYLKPSKGYDIAKAVFGKEKNPPTAKIYPNLTKMEKLGYIKRDNQGIYHVEIDPMISYLDNILQKQNLNLNDSDRFYLTCILNSHIFKNYFSLIYNPLYIPKVTHKSANFIDGISNMLAFSASHTLQSLEDKPDEKDALSKIYHDLKKTQPDDILGKNQPLNEKNLFRGLVRILDLISQDPDNKKWSETIGQDAMDFLKDMKKAMKNT